MRVLEWIETDTQYWAVVQPRSWFEEDSLFDWDRHDREAIIMGRRQDSGEIDICAYAWDKNVTPLWLAKDIVASYPDIFTPEERAAIEDTWRESQATGQAVPYPVERRAQELALRETPPDQQGYNHDTDQAHNAGDRAG